jgi:hypothetical protein
MYLQGGTCGGELIHENNINLFYYLSVLAPGLLWSVNYYEVHVYRRLMENLIGLSLLLTNSEW